MTTPRLATVADAEPVAALLDAFNREFATPTPGPDVLAARLRRLLAGPELFAVRSGDPAVAVALVTLRPNVWYDGPVALLEELYVVPAMRGRGLGTELLGAVEDEVRRRGGQALEINVDGDDTDARRFYERHGYACVEPGQDPERVEPMLYYARDLGSPARPGPRGATRCACEPDLDDVHHARQCDYCGTSWAGSRCVHDAYRQPCPECDVVPLVQV